jgi:hypothetical protein
MTGIRQLGYAIAALTLASASPLQAAECVICANSVVMNEDLATCFLEKYGDPETVAGETVAVDLSRCERSRSIVLALPEPRAAVEEPDTKFLLSRGQVECLKDRLQSDEIDLDPSARIDLGTCR